MSAVINVGEQGEQGTYVYAIARDLELAVVDGVPGVGGAPVRTVEFGGLIAIVSTVDLDEFGEAAIQRNLEDLAWLEQTARSHHAVTEAAGRTAAVAPLRLATVYYDDQRVRSLLQEQHDAFGRALDRITGRVEWGVKGYAQVPDGRDAEPDRSEPGAGRPTSRPESGAAYLRRRREQQQNRHHASEEATRQADAVHAELRTFAAASRLHRPQDAGLSGHGGWMVLNGAYLVDRARGDDFIDLVRSLAGVQEGLEIEVTGPWAPYSFATVDGNQQDEQNKEALS